MSKNGKKREVFTIDCETDPFLFGREPKPFLWGLYSERTGFQSFKTAQEVLEVLYDKRAVVFAHNGGKFDFLFLQDYLVPWSNVRIINGRVSSFKINDCIFRDSFLILPTALGNYKKDKIDYTLFEKETRDSHMDEITKYLEGDCRYLFELVMGFAGTTGPVLLSHLPRSRFSEKWERVRKFLRHRACTMNASNHFITVGG